MLRDLRAGDTLVLLAIGDLGAGKGLRNMRAELASRGVGVEVVEPVKEASQPAPRGRPPAWSPDPSDDERFGNMWRDPSVDGAYIIDRVAEVMGEEANTRPQRERIRQRLLRRYGARVGHK